MKKTYEIDGNDFSTLEEFYDVISRTLIPGTSWGKNLAAFNDILRGGFGTPDEGFILRWKNSSLSAEKLGWEETVRYVERKMTTCHPSNREHVARDLDDARHGYGQTIFEIIVDIIRNHGAGGDEANDYVELIID